MKIILRKKAEDTIISFCVKCKWPFTILKYHLLISLSVMVRVGSQ